MTAIPVDGSSEAVVTDPTGEAPEATPTGTEAEVDPFAPVAGEPTSFPQDYVAKLRREGANYRTQLRDTQAKLAEVEPLAGAFDGWAPEQAEGWKTFLGQAQQDPEGAIGALMQQAYGLDREGATALLDSIFEAGGETPPTPAGESGDPDDPNRPLTRAEYNELEAQKAEERGVQQALNALKSEATELGYKPDGGPGTPDEFRYHRLLHIASTNGNNLQAAHSSLVKEEQALVKDHLARMAAEADGSPAPTGGNGSPGESATGAPQTFEGADARTREYLASRPSS